MHVKLKQDESQLTDSMKMSKWAWKASRRPRLSGSAEWFYKGDGVA
jgi:hypothetical protein